MKCLVLAVFLAATAAAETYNSSFVVYSVPDYYTWSNMRYPVSDHKADPYHYERYPYYYHDSPYQYHDRPYHYYEKPYNYHDKAYYNRQYGLREIAEHPLVLYVYDPQYQGLIGCVLESGLYDEKKCSPTFHERITAAEDKAGFVFYANSFQKGEFIDDYVKYFEFPHGLRISSMYRMSTLHQLPFFIVSDKKHFPYYKKEYLKEVGEIEVTDHLKIIRDIPHHAH